MRTIDFTPLFRSTVGFDRMQRMMETAMRTESQNGYPPYNIESHGENTYRITMAVAGFSQDDLELTQTENTLIVKGQMRDEDDSATFLHRGIAGRPFERRFDLADHIKVTDANMDNGLLNIELVREIPEEKKPRQISVRSNTASIMDKAA